MVEPEYFIGNAQRRYESLDRARGVDASERRVSNADIVRQRVNSIGADSQEGAGLYGSLVSVD